MRLNWQGIIGKLEEIKSQLVSSKGDESALTVWTKPTNPVKEFAADDSSEQNIAPALCGNSFLETKNYVFPRYYTRSWTHYRFSIKILPKQLRLQAFFKKKMDKADCLPGWESSQSLINGAATYPIVSAGVFSTFGARGPDKMEDRHVLHPNFHELFKSKLPPAHLFCVFDGHRGAEASEFCSNHVVNSLTSR